MKYLWLALFGLFFSISSFADSYPGNISNWKSNQFPTEFFTTGELACKNVASHYSSSSSYDHITLTNTISGACFLKSNSNGSVFQMGNISADGTCPYGGSFNAATGVCTSAPECAAGTVRDPQTGQCVAPCGSGQTRVNGVCTCDNGAQVGSDGVCCPVAGSGGGAPMQWCYVDGPSASNCETTASNKCKIRCTNVTFQQGTGAQLNIYPKLALGQSCKYTGTVNATSLGGGPLNNDELNEVSEATAEPGRADTPEGCLASGQGYVTGSSGTTCVSGGDTGVTSNETSTETNSDGSSDTTNETSTQGDNGTGSETTTETHINPDGSTTTTTTTTTCHQDGTCTTTTQTTSKDAGGNTTDETSKTKDEPKSKFCDEKPESAMCKDFDETCKQNPDRASCRDLGEPPDEGLFSASEVGPSSISAVAVGGSGQCPQGPALPLGLGNFSFDGICQLANGIRPIIIALAWLAAGLIVIGAFRES